MIKSFPLPLMHYQTKQMRRTQEIQPKLKELQQKYSSRDPETQRKLNLFLSKILKEFNTNKRSRGRVRMISSRSMDFYYNDFEYEPLSDQEKFYVHLNRGVNKMNGDLFFIPNPDQFLMRILPASRSFKSFRSWRVQATSISY